MASAMLRKRSKRKKKLKRLKRTRSRFWMIWISSKIKKVNKIVKRKRRTRRKKTPMTNLPPTSLPRKIIKPDKLDISKRLVLASMVRESSHKMIRIVIFCKMGSRTTKSNLIKVRINRWKILWILGYINCSIMKMRKETKRKDLKKLMEFQRHRLRTISRRRSLGIELRIWIRKSRRKSKKEKSQKRRM